MDFSYNSETLIVIGASGTGKTTILKPIIEAIDRKIILDTDAEYPNSGSEIKVNSIYRPKAYDPNELEMFVSKCRAFYDFCMIIEDVDAYGINEFNVPSLKVVQVNGRHQAIGQIITSRRITGLPMLMLMKAKYLIIFGISKMFKSRAEYTNYIEFIPTLDYHFNFVPHEYVIYEMRLDVATPIYHYKP